jgi:hypothetical protein
MADTGCYARRMFDLIELKLCQWLHWRRTSPVTFNTSQFLSSFCPISPLRTHRGRRRAAILCAVIHGRDRAKLLSADILDAVPWRIQECNGCWGREHGVIGHLLSDCLIRQSFSLTPVREGHPLLPPSTVARLIFTILDDFKSYHPGPNGGNLPQRGKEFYSGPSMDGGGDTGCVPFF